MNVRTKLQTFSRDRLALVLGIYILLQPILDVLTAFGAVAGHPPASWCAPSSWC